MNRFMRAFTLVEILMVMVLVGVVALPFTRMFIFGMQGTTENIEHIIAYNLAREKIEEVRSLPFHLIKSDFENFASVFRDRPGLDQAFENRDEFEKTFSDLFTQETSAKDPDAETYKRLKGLYKSAFLRDLELYSDDTKVYRRVMDVDARYDSAVPARLKKVTVRVYDAQQHRLAEVVTLVGQHR
ncbi:MAG TPA: prepilin-type N-terminal cleavage/methylation domain-containing protein [Candidatus Ozemobacteraceae bacterium]|nr:prepilin-type N-terminal cleavage/methylation domain-containing protein [Candidatus Ozemobacteraceae bacterium]